MTLSGISRLFISAAVILFSILGCATQQAAHGDSEKATLNPYEMIKAIEQAKFADFEGETVSVSDFKGKVVMIDFWETWCKPCTNSFPAVQKLLQEYPDDFVVLAVTPGWRDNKYDARRFANRHDYAFTYLIDNNDLHTRIGVHGIPHKVFIDPSGSFFKSSVGSAGPKKDYKKIKQIVKAHRSKK